MPETIELTPHWPGMREYVRAMYVDASNTRAAIESAFHLHCEAPTLTDLVPDRYDAPIYVETLLGAVLKWGESAELGHPTFTAEYLRAVERAASRCSVGGHKRAERLRAMRARVSALADARATHEALKPEGT